MCLIGQVVPSLFLLVNDYYIIKATKKKNQQKKECSTTFWPLDHIQ